MSNNQYQPRKDPIENIRKWLLFGGIGLAIIFIIAVKISINSPKPNLVTIEQERYIEELHPDSIYFLPYETVLQLFESEMVFVEGGTFTMGTPDPSVGYPAERPAHQVTLSSYHIGKYEVTQAQWKAIMGRTQRQQRDMRDKNMEIFGEGDNYPVYYINWYDIVGTSGDYMELHGRLYFEDGFIYKLNKLTGKNFRLPTEAEWEYAARGGNKSAGYLYSGSNTIDDVSWYADNKVKPVGGKLPNELGIYDMTGNVWEWCSDWYARYTSDAKTNPTGAESFLSVGDYGAVRGGAWGGDTDVYRVSRRQPSSVSNRGRGVGFRIAHSL